MFKRLFSKLDKDCSQDTSSNELISDGLGLKAYIVIGTDIDDDNFVAVNFLDGQQPKMTELLFLLYSGLLAEDIVASLKTICSDTQANLILQSVASLLKQYHDTQKLSTSTPVVNPCEVFHTSEKNEFKG